MRANQIVEEYKGEQCDTLFYPGMGSSQTQVLKYVGTQKIVATTGEIMWCPDGSNHLPPLNVIYKPHLSPEVPDINLNPFANYFSYLNPIKLISAAVTWASNKRNGCYIIPATYAQPESVRFHSPNISQISIGQQSDINAHVAKYQNWLEKPDKTNGLILWGVSRGTAATFCAMAQKKYSDVRLVVLEGAIDSIPNIISTRATQLFKSEYISQQVSSVINSTFAFFNRCHLLQYHPTGHSPLNSVVDFPEGVPVVFITSKADTTVPYLNTKRIARALADKGKNDVYCLELKYADHRNYMFNNSEDRESYNNFIHAIYKKYGLRHDPELASRGQHLVNMYTLHEVESRKSSPRKTM